MKEPKLDPVTSTNPNGCGGTNARNEKVPSPRSNLKANTNRNRY